ncbi:hypothetical protein BU16DRAFT_178580 [Lophium mytilinum]|uniref:PAS domain-containing protein n=1 Tax=Lophium mytilinum TaxID=390894 RepID=A0A6A6QBE9_9PEZI|nr:hypothetical protein BU16DRAFT_178580 [Lophium mytilinum]
MDTTFITIHDLSQDAKILYSSDSIVDILGHTPDEVVNKSCWDFFHPEELPLARKLHSRGVDLDKAAVLAYCRIQNRQGEWIGCECCFSVVYDVMVVCTSIYRRGESSQKRAVEAPLVRRLFSSSPKDPRYHMLSHLSSKFNLGPQEQTHEPRAALFLNRFTRTLTVMYATSGIEQIIGIPSEEMKGRSFYFCIQENCLEDAIRCLESAKGNDSIAYLRFWFRDPRQDDRHDSITTADSEDDAEMTDVTASDDEDDNGTGSGTGASTSTTSNSMDTHEERPHNDSRTNSGSSSNPADSNEAIFGEASNPHSIDSSVGSPGGSSVSRNDPIELEAVVSCTSDGLVVCLRRARPIMPSSAGHVPAAAGQLQAPPRGMFAAPWAPEPVFFPPLQAAPPFPLGAQHPAMMNMPWQQPQVGPSQMDFMNSIRDVAVFAWALTGINGSLAEYSRGKPVGDSQPPEGFPIWQPEGFGHDGAGMLPATPSGYHSAGSGSGGSVSGTAQKDPFGDPGLSGNSGQGRNQYQ